MAVKRPKRHARRLETHVPGLTLVPIEDRTTGGKGA